MDKGDSLNYKGRLGTGLAEMKFHNQTNTGYCLTCRSKICRKIAYIPPLPKGWVWSWEAVRQFYLAPVR